jgi:hypothetical protein
MLRANAGILSAIAGVFMLLPTMLIARYAPQPVRGDSVEQWLADLSTYFATSWPWQLLAALAGAIGVIAIYLLLLGRPRMTVAAALRRALVLVPGYFAVSLILVFLASCGFMLLILPGLFLLGRLVLASPAVVAETPNAPLAAVQRGWELSQGRAWSIAGLLMIVYFVAMVASAALQTGLGTLLLLLVGRGGVVLLMLAFLQGLISAAFGLVLTVLIAAIYREAKQRRP